jgi:tagatose-1,6-bisphosphate aldolase non-catalytic subunit AgaZ/GatZ
MKHTNDIVAMAQEAGFKRHHNPDLYDCMVASDEAIECFATLVADRCAEIAHEAEPFHSADLIRKAFGVDK